MNIRLGRKNVFSEIPVSLSLLLSKLPTPAVAGAFFPRKHQLGLEGCFSLVSDFFNPFLLKFSTPATLSYRSFFLL
eukprot:TRINITY_DN966_c0_g1_i1.p1 TRINITY_DN966_c0_g1~~TRINITY_DN966_c0_g1_i1.p1  ORF type:complete len:76 (-),score=5.28 TRINITY_DN966_c0_g1_i1:148-375(-)